MKCQLPVRLPTWTPTLASQNLQQRKSLPTLTADFGLAVSSPLIRISKNDHDTT